MNHIARLTFVTFADGTIGRPNKPSPIDQAWRTRLPIGSSRPYVDEYQAELAREREIASAKYWAAQKRELETKAARPFRFEDLEGKPEPEAVHAAVRAANAPRKAPNTLPTSSNCASGQATTFSAAKHRAKLIGELRSAAARDRLAWATSEGIREAYKAAMAAKRNRESAIAAAEAVRPTEAACIARAFGRPLAEAA
jgi:hypothetical protein